VSGIVGYLLFFLAGVGFGFAALPKWRWLPLLFPLALAITVLGIFLGAMLDARSRESDEHARYA